MINRSIYPNTPPALNMRLREDAYCFVCSEQDVCLVLELDDGPVDYTVCPECFFVIASVGVVMLGKRLPVDIKRWLTIASENISRE